LTAFLTGCWAGLFLARGMKVTVVDPRPEAENQLVEFVKDAWPLLSDLGLTLSEQVQEAGFLTDSAQLSDIDFVQECGPERIEVKRQIVASLESVLAPDTVISSSTSSLKASDIIFQLSFSSKTEIRGHVESVEKGA
jgi:carnitine 3-dehydrogenase